MSGCSWALTSAYRDAGAREGVRHPRHVGHRAADTRRRSSAWA